MLRRISLFLLLLLSLNAWADLYYQTYRGTGAYPNMPYYGTGALFYPTVLSSGTVTAINHTWGLGNVLNSGRSEQVLVKYWGYIYVPGSGSQTLTFYNSSDDGFYMRINNQVVINDWQEQGPGYYNGSGSITLTGGQYYSVEVWYYENGGGATAQLYWNQSGSITLVPTSSYYLTEPAPAYSSGITSAQQTRKNNETTQRINQSGNEIQIEQIGDNNSFTIRQGITITGKNRIELYANGDNNTLNLNQGYNADGSIPASEYNNHYQYLNLFGSSNNVTTKQINGNSTVGHFMETTMSGNTNTVNATQQGTGSKTLFLNVNGGSNGATVNQKDGGQHYLDLSLTGNGHTVNATQEGAGNHAATINLTNSGGPATLNLNQGGSTSQVYSIQQSCANAYGCATTITQP